MHCLVVVAQLAEQSLLIPEVRGLYGRGGLGRPPRFFDNSGSGSGRPPQFFDKLGHVGMPYPEFSSIFPGHFRSDKNREKSREIGINRGKSGKIGDNPDCSRLTSNFLKGRDGHLDLSRHFRKNRDGHPDLSRHFGISRDGHPDLLKSSR